MGDCDSAPKSRQTRGSPLGRVPNAGWPRCARRAGVHVARRPFRRDQDRRAATTGRLGGQERVDLELQCAQLNTSGGVFPFSGWNGLHAACRAKLVLLPAVSTVRRSGLCQSVHCTRSLHSLLLSVPPSNELCSRRIPPMRSSPSSIWTLSDMPLYERVKSKLDPSSSHQ